MYRMYRRGCVRFDDPLQNECLIVGGSLVKRGALTATFPALKIFHFVRIYFYGIPILGIPFVSRRVVVSQLGKIIRIDTKSVRSAGRSTGGVKLLDLDSDDKVAATVVIPPEEAKTQPEEGRFCSSLYRYE